MYIPAHFNEPRAEALYDLIEKNPLGILFTNGRHGLDANHIPFELKKREGQLGVLHSHVARANPNWYPSKREFKKQVPTWNYQVAHAYCRATIRDDERYVRGMVARLTRIHEEAQADPWKMTDSPKDHMDTLLKVIVGIEFEMTRLEGKFKLSQNRETRDILSAGQALKQQGDDAIGDAMLAFAAARAEQGR
jgi:transcriptional regulator